MYHRLPDDSFSILRHGALPMIRLGRPACPRCEMRMIVVKGYGKRPRQKTFECLRCGHVIPPGPETP